MTFLRPIRKKNIAAFALIVALPLFVACQGIQAQADSTKQNYAHKQAPLDWALSPSAQATFDTLTFLMAIQTDDVEASLNAIERTVQANPPAQWYGDTGNFLLMNDENLMAQKLMQKGTVLYPNDLSIRLIYAEAALRQEKGHDAITVLEEYYKAHSDDATARFELMKTYLAAQQFAAAESLIASIPLKEQNAILHYYHAKAFMGMNDLDSAEKYFLKASEISPDFLECYAELAYIYETRKDFASAERVYQKLVPKEKSSADLWKRLVDMNIKLNKPEKAYERAMEGYTTLLQENPDEAMDFILIITKAFLDLRYIEQAKNILVLLEKEENTPQEAYFFLAVLAYEQENNNAQSLAYLDKINITSEYHKKALQLQGQIYYEQGDIAKALESIQKGLTLYPQRKVFYEMALQFYLNTDADNSALSIANQGLSQWPDDAYLYFWRGIAFENLGRQEEALLSMEKANKYSPNDAPTLNYIGYSLLELNQDLDRALSLIERAIALDPENGHIMDSLAWAYYKLGRFDEALKAIIKAIDLGAQEGTIWEHYGDIARATGDKETAYEAYVQALDSGAENPEQVIEKLRTLAK